MRNALCFPRDVIFRWVQNENSHAAIGCYSGCCWPIRGAPNSQEVKDHEASKQIVLVDGKIVSKVKEQIITSLSKWW